MFPDCVLPGCRNPVADANEPCQSCLRAFGPMLRPGGPKLTERDVARRDAATRAVYAMRRTA